MKQNYMNIVSRILDHLEDDNAEKATMACLRLARLTQDYLNLAVFYRELGNERKLVAEAIYPDLQSLSKEQRIYILDRSLEIWLEERTVDYSAERDPDAHTVFVKGIGELDLEIDQLEKSISDYDLPERMGEYDLAAFTDRNQQTKAEIRYHIKNINTVRARAKTRCLTYATQIERQLQLQEDSNQYVFDIQNEVNNYFKARSNRTAKSLMKASQLAHSKETEDSSNSLASTRRAIKAVADHFYPATNEQVECQDGKFRKMGEEQYLNRLDHFIRSSLTACTETEVLTAEFGYLSELMRRINDLASKGVHSEVSKSTAKQGVLSLYLFLYNLIARLGHENTPESEQSSHGDTI